MTGGKDELLLAAALRLRRQSRCRLTVFGRFSGLFREPAWEMLIEAFIADRRGDQLHVKTLTSAANVPSTTALRWVREIEHAGFLERRRSEVDRRAWILALTETGRRYVTAYLHQSDG